MPCPNTSFHTCHVWKNIFTTRSHLTLKCNFCGEEVRILRPQGIGPCQIVTLINMEMESRKDPVGHPPKYPVVIPGKGENDDDERSEAYKVFD